MASKGRMVGEAMADGYSYTLMEDEKREEVDEEVEEEVRNFKLLAEVFKASQVTNAGWL